MQSIVTKNKRGEVTNTITGQKKLQEETANFWGKIFADENIETTEQDIWNYLGNTDAQEAKKSQKKKGRKWMRHRRDY